MKPAVYASIAGVHYVVETRRAVFQFNAIKQGTDFFLCHFTKYPNGILTLNLA
ncbi:MAG: hypothetical protein OXB92_17165 [Acidimicrobiaceae bacterium]|nr:hypothetical protein [Acidimicrobiaceae bacterium]